MNSPHPVKLGLKMKPLRKFFMEDPLEQNRFLAKYNLGESGGRVRTISELLLQSGLTKESIFEIFLQTKLCDSPNWGRQDLRKLVADMHPGASIDNVLITTGTSEALFLLFRFLNPKSVALALPAFQLLYELPLAQQAKIIPLPVRWEANGTPFIDEEEWITQIKKHKPTCLLINNPHNPSGLILSSQFMHRLSHVAKWLKCTIIGDEHYRFLSHPQNILGNTVYQKNSFVTGSFIKCLGVPGLRIGWCVGPKKALMHMQNEKNYTTHTVNPITEWIAYEVLKNFNSELFKKMKEEWLANKNILQNFLASSDKIIGTVPQGGLVTALGFKKTNNLMQTRKIIKNLRAQEIFVLPLESMEFGKFAFQKQACYFSKKLSGINRGYGFRLGLGCESEKFKWALEEIEKNS